MSSRYGRSVLAGRGTYFRRESDQMVKLHLTDERGDYLDIYLPWGDVESFVRRQTPPDALEPPVDAEGS